MRISDWSSDVCSSDLYWQSVREGTALPRAADFDLLALTNWLPDICLLDVHDANNVAYRFAGTAIVERMGHDPSGSNVLHDQTPSQIDRTSRAYRTVANRTDKRHLRQEGFRPCI